MKTKLVLFLSGILVGGFLTVCFRGQTYQQVDIITSKSVGTLEDLQNLNDAIEKRLRELGVYQAVRCIVSTRPNQLRLTFFSVDGKTDISEKIIENIQQTVRQERFKAEDSGRKGSTPDTRRS